MAPNCDNGPSRPQQRHERPRAVLRIRLCSDGGRNSVYFETLGGENSEPAGVLGADGEVVYPEGRLNSSKLDGCLLSRVSSLGLLRYSFV
jgi:hypothetical protein